MTYYRNSPIRIEKVPIPQNLVLKSFLLTKENIELILKRSKEKNIQSETEKVIDTL
jgi:hypothetical protein